MSGDNNLTAIYTRTWREGDDDDDNDVLRNSSWQCNRDAASEWGMIVWKVTGSDTSVEGNALWQVHGMYW